MKDNGRKTVLVLLSPIGDYSMQMFEGIQKFARTTDWHLQTVEYARKESGGYRLTCALMGSNIEDLLDFWKPDGCIVDSGQPENFLRPADFEGCPTVFLNRHPPADQPDMVCVYSNAESIVKVAARELLMTGYKDFAYVPWPEDTPWSAERGDAFAKIIRLNGKALHTFDYPEESRGGVRTIDFLMPWLVALPKPCGVFAACDLIAESVLLACTRMGFRVPKEVAVVGVDNFVQVCENSRPTISSVRQDFEKAGVIAAETLAEMMEEETLCVPSRTYPAGEFVRRESSRVIKGGDRRVAKALEYIRLHAREGIGVKDVVAEMGLSRRTAEMHFREATGHSIFDEINEVRFAKVFDLLRNPLQQLDAVPDLCGFNTDVALRKAFRLRTGMSMRDWRKRNRLI
ncbi:MAG: substrate-binding domain-containing protein [Kiritimatiellia bacterium]|jgi:LacI family transcriptional regulator